MKKLFLKQVVTPAARGKGGQVPNHSGPTREAEMLQAWGPVYKQYHRDSWKTQTIT